MSTTTNSQDRADISSRWLWLALFFGLILPCLTLADAPLADSMALRIKSRVSTPLELFQPSQTEFANPYYRPLYILVQGLVDQCTDSADWGLRALAVACFLAAAIALIYLGRKLRCRNDTLFFGVLLFALVPGNVFTVSWPVVAYWTLAAALAYWSIRCLVEFQSSGSKQALALALLLQALSLLSSQTCYQFVALCGVLWLIPAVPPRVPGPRKRILVAWPVIVGMVWVHFQYLETTAQGLAGENWWAPLFKALRSSQDYLWAVLGSDPAVGSRVVAYITVGLVVIGICNRDRLTWFLLLFALAAPLPFGALGFAERYAFYSSGPLCLLTAHAILHGIPAIAHRMAPSSTALVTRLAQGSLVLLLVINAYQSWHRFQELHQAAEETEVLVSDLREILPQIENIEDALFVNMPPMLKWSINDILNIRDRELFIQPRQQTYFHTDHAYFAFGSSDLSAVARWVVLGEDGRLRLVDPKQPMGDRTPLMQPWFLAADYEVFETQAGWRAEKIWAEMFNQIRRQKDPRAKVFVESDLQLRRPLPTTGVEYEYTPPGSDSAHGALRVRSDLPQSGLLVVVTYLGVEDPVHRVGGDTGRFCAVIRAFLDGEPAEIIPVDFHLTGIIIPPGEHEVEVRLKFAD